MATPLFRSTSSLVALAPLVLAVVSALGCSAPPGSGEDDDDGPRPYSGNPAGNNPAMSTGGLQPSPGNPGAPGNTGTGGSAGSEAPGSNAGFNQPPAANNNGQAPNTMSPMGAAGAPNLGAAGAPNTGAAGTGGVMAPGAGGAGAMPVTPPVTTPPVTTPPPPPPVTPPPAGNAGCPGQLLCEDFEEMAAGPFLTSNTWQVIDGYAERAQGTSELVSTDQAHTGTQSLRVLASGARNGIVATLPMNRYFLRAWLRVDAAPLGPVFIGLGTDQNSETRLRIQGQSLATINTVGPGDAVRPGAATSGNCPECVPMPVATWFCAEFFIDQATQSATLWINGNEAASIVNGQGGWPVQPAAPQLFLGSMGLQGGMAGVFIDDVAVGTARITCD
jgi:hypothetical protein